jgi:hypothetical protein
MVAADKVCINEVQLQGLTRAPWVVNDCASDLWVGDQHVPAVIAYAYTDSSGVNVRKGY